MAEEPAEGEAPAGEEVEEPQGLDEFELLKRMGMLDVENNKDGLKGIFINTSNFMAYGLVQAEKAAEGLHFTGKNSVPYKFLDKSFIDTDVKERAFASDFQALHKDVQKAPGDQLLLIRDMKKTCGENFAFCPDKKVLDKWTKMIDEKKAEIEEAYEEEMAAAAGGAEGGEVVVGEDGVAVPAAAPIEEEPEIFVYDGPVTPRAWASETAEKSHGEVADFTVPNTRPLHQAKIEQPRKFFGAPCKYNDTAGEVQTCRQQKDPNFALNKRELDCGIQAVPITVEQSCMTQWFRPVNAFTQYSKDHFLDKNLGEDELLAGFLTRVSRPIEEALQQNETVDIFQDEFASLGEEDMGFGSKSTSNIKEVRNFHDVTYTKAKRVQWTEWVPDTATTPSPMLVSSVCDNMLFNDRVEGSGKASISHVLVWSFHDSLAPHAVIQSPWEVTYFKFWPSDKHYLIGGLSTGQIIFWKLTDENLGIGSRDTKKSAEEEKDTSVMTITHKLLSTIDDAHRKPVIGIAWLPPDLEFEARGRGRPKAMNPPDGPMKYFVTTSSDGQVLVWDFLAALEGLEEPDFQWRPVHRAQLQRQDSGTEMGLCHLIYNGMRTDEKGVLTATNFWASTEEGELIFGDWAARSEDDRKPEFVKRMYNTSKTYRPMVALERSPFFPEILLGVTDWAFYLWKDGLKTHFFQSPSPQNYFTAGAWSPTRPSVLYLGRIDGALEIWDFSDQSHRHSLLHLCTSVAISNLRFLPADSEKQDMFAVGDEQGHLHVLDLPKNLVRPAGNERKVMEQLMQREEERVGYFLERNGTLQQMRDEMERQAQMGGTEEVKKEVNQEAEDAKCDADYRRLEAAFCDSLGITPAHAA